MRSPRITTLAATLALASSLVGCAALLGCAATTEVEVADDSALGGSALSGGVTVGTEVATTTAVNFRRGPSASSEVIRTLAKGAALVVTRASPEGAFYAVKSDGDEGWVHGKYLERRGAAPPAPGGCVERRLRFSADDLPAIPGDTAWVWGGNATAGEAHVDPPYAPDFLSRARAAKSRGLEVFAYLEGPCGDTGGVDDGERARCRSLHRSYNQRFAPQTPDTDQARWKPYTMKQLTTSGVHGVDYCEIDNLSNNVTVALEPLLREIKQRYDAGEIRCRLVLKNVSAAAIDGLRASVAPTPADAAFIAPFHVYEADDLRDKARLDAAMVRLKGPGAVTIISTDTNHYGAAFTPDRFLTCR